PRSSADPQPATDASVEGEIVARSHGTPTIEELELDDRTARDEAPAFLDGGDDLFGVDRLTGVSSGARLDERKGARVAGPLVLDAMRVARSGRGHPPAEVQDAEPVLEHVLGQLASAELVSVVDLE